MRVKLLAVSDIRGIIAINKFDIINWSSKEDKKFFKEITMKSGVVVMGRRTFEIIGRKLPNRVNVVLSKSLSSSYKKSRISDVTNEKIPDIILSGEPQEILSILKNYGYYDICIIGGQHVFTQFINSGLVTDIYLTIEPFILPGSINLFSDEIMKKFKLKLENITKLNENGTINIHYTLK